MPARTFFTLFTCLLLSACAVQPPAEGDATAGRAKAGSQAAAEPAEADPEAADPEAADPEAASRDADAGPWVRARQRGPILRAIGQEPGWWLEIRQDGTTELVSDYGMRQQLWETPPPEPLGASGKRYSLRRAGLTVTLREEDCQDVMSGERFPLRVVVETPQQRLEGCGRWLNRE